MSSGDCSAYYCPVVLSSALSCSLIHGQINTKSKTWGDLYSYLPGSPCAALFSLVFCLANSIHIGFLEQQTVSLSQQDCWARVCHFSDTVQKLPVSRNTHRSKVTCFPSSFINHCLVLSVVQCLKIIISCILYGYLVVQCGRQIPILVTPFCIEADVLLKSDKPEFKTKSIKMEIYLFIDCYYNPQWKYNIIILFAQIYSFACSTNFDFVGKYCMPALLSYWTI